MAIRSEDLYGSQAEIFVFPTSFARRRAARQRHVAMIRRRIVAATLVAMMVFGLLTVAGAAPSVSSIDGAPAHVKVRAGVTVWELAQRFAAPGSDPRAYVDAIWDLNGLDAPPRPGARLKLPR